MRARILLGVVFGLLTAPAWAQDDAINWLTDVSAATNQARTSRRPLMIYVMSSTKDRDEKIERAQRKALADPKVLALVPRFVPLRISRSENRDNLADFGFPPMANLMISFLSPDGKPLGDVPSETVGQPEALAKRMAQAFDAYRRRLFDEEIKPVLESAESRPADLRAALKLVADFHIVTADKSVLAVLERPRLDGAVRKVVLETLASLSTKPAITELLEMSQKNDAVATKALEKCTPVGAELLLPALESDNGKFDFALYKTILKVCNIRTAKPAAYFKSARPEQAQQELERITPLVQDAAQQWRDTYAEAG
jgi:hypothetical protein